jgi:hypothetical protein
MTNVSTKIDRSKLIADLMYITTWNAKDPIRSHEALDKLTLEILKQLDPDAARLLKQSYKELTLWYE